MSELFCKCGDGFQEDSICFTCHANELLELERLRAQLNEPWMCPRCQRCDLQVRHANAHSKSCYSRVTCQCLEADKDKHDVDDCPGKTQKEHISSRLLCKLIDKGVSPEIISSALFEVNR